MKRALVLGIGNVFGAGKDFSVRYVTALAPSRSAGDEVTRTMSAKKMSLRQTALQHVIATAQSMGPCLKDLVLTVVSGALYSDRGFACVSGLAATKDLGAAHAAGKTGT